MSRDITIVTKAVEQFLGRPGSVTGVTTLSAGHSNETYLIHGLDIILRTPPSGAGLLPPYDMRKQHDVLAELQGKVPSVPVPAVLGACEDERLLGAPFYLCTNVEGECFEYRAPQWLAEAVPKERASLCTQWIGTIAELHCAPALDSLGNALSPEQEFGEWRDRALDKGGPHGAAIAATFDQLATIGYVRSGVPAPVHGDPKIGNLMWRERKLAAILDWELAHNGDPLSDLGYILCWFPADANERFRMPPAQCFGWSGMFSRADVIATWERHSGRSARGVELYEAASWAKLWTIIHVGAVTYASGEIDDPRMATWGQILPFLRERTKRAVAGLAATA